MSEGVSPAAGAGAGAGAEDGRDGDGQGPGVRVEAAQVRAADRRGVQADDARQAGGEGRRDGGRGVGRMEHAPVRRLVLVQADAEGGLHGLGRAGHVQQQPVRVCAGDGQPVGARVVGDGGVVLLGRAEAGGELVGGEELVEQRVLGVVQASEQVGLALPGRAAAGPARAGRARRRPFGPTDGRGRRAARAGPAVAPCRRAGVCAGAAWRSPSASSAASSSVGRGRRSPASAEGG